MALFLVICRDKPNAIEIRMANRPAHLDWAGSHKETLAMAGPIFAEDGETFAGSVFVKIADSKADVEAWCADDPYAKAGLFERVEIRPFKWVLGDGPQA